MFVLPFVVSLVVISQLDSNFWTTYPPSQLPRRRFAVTSNVDKLERPNYRKAPIMISRKNESISAYASTFYLPVLQKCGPFRETFHKQTISITVGWFINTNISRLYLSLAQTSHNHTVICVDVTRAAAALIRSVLNPQRR